MPKLKINHEAFRHVIEKTGLANNELARLLGLDKTVVSRVLRGEIRPGNRFIAGVWSLFGIAALSELFAIDEED